jgi:sugar lactone lactonase YvrE
VGGSTGSGGSGGTAGSGGTGGTTGTTTPFDCTAPLPAPPLAYDELFGWGTAEDFDFDGEGWHVSIRDGNLIRKDQYGNFEILSPGISSFTSGTRVMVTGEVIVANSQDNEVLKIDPKVGSQEVIASSISYPNGIEMSQDGRWVWVASNGSGNVRQLDAITGESFFVADGIDGANGLVLSVKEDALFVTTCTGEGVWKIPRIDDTTWDEKVQLWHDAAPFLCIDGINVDVCDNVYFTEWIEGVVRRIPSDGLTAPEIVTSLPSTWIPNMRWGVGVGGWDPDLLYVADRDEGRLFPIHTLIPGKKHVLAP